MAKPPPPKPAPPKPSKSVPPTPDPTIDAMVRLAVAQSVCMNLIDAAAHVRRTSILVEAASTAALMRALQAPEGDRSWVQALEGAGVMMSTASAAFVAATQSAMAMAVDPPKPPSVP
jgi:hypothetical protein